MNHQRRRIIAVVLMLSLFAVALLGNIFLTMYFLDTNFPTGFNIFFFASLGLLVSQPCLLSIWCAMGGQRQLLRILISLGMLVCLTVTYTWTIENDGAPLEICLIICGIALAIAAVVQIPLWLFRVYTRQSIFLPTDEKPKLEGNQFGIKHLLIATTVSAVIVSLSSTFFSSFDFDSGPARGFPWLQLITFLSFFVCLSGIFTFLNLAVVFSSKRRRVFLLLLSIFLITTPLGCVEMFRKTTLFNPIQLPALDLTMVINAIAFIWSLVFTVVGVLFSFYAIGFRMQRLQNN